MKWTIHRAYKDFQTLHSGLRLLYIGRREKLPDFPRYALPFWLGPLAAVKEHPSEWEISEQTLGSGIAAGAGALAGSAGGGASKISKTHIRDLQRLKLQEYLTQLVSFLVPFSVRLTWLIYPL